VKSNLLLRPLVCAFCFLALPGLRPALAEAPTLTLSQLLLRHRNAAETPAAQKNKTPRGVVYDIHAGSLSGTMSVYEAFPHQERKELRLGPVAVTGGTDGTQAWEQDPSGNVRLLTGEELAESKADSNFSLEDFNPLTDNDKAAVTLRAALDPETGCYVLDVKLKNGSPSTFYLDPQTYLTRKRVSPSGGLSGTATYLAYQEHEGVQLPSRISLRITGFPLVLNATLRTVASLPTLAASLFQPPTIAKDWLFLSPAQNSAVTLPFEIIGNEIVVPVTINDHPLHMMLDSGASGMFITEAAAKALSLPLQDSLPALGYGGAASLGEVTDTTVDIGGGVQISHLPIDVIKNAAYTRLSNQNDHTDGSIGYGLFSRFRVSIDYAAKTLALSDPTAAQPPLSAATVVVPIKLEAGTPTIMASVDGRASGRFTVDTGNSGPVSIYNQFATLHKMMPKTNDPDVRIRRGFGIGGAFRFLYWPHHTIRVGSAQISNQPISLVTGPGMAQVSTEAGNIGNVFLSHFVVTFDYVRGLMYLTPAPAAKAELTAAWSILVAAVKPAAVPTLTLGQILARHRMASGTAAARKDKTPHAVVYDISAGGLAGTMTTYEAPPHRSRMEMRLGPLNTTTGSDGKITWEQDGTGNVRILGGEELAERSADEGFSLENFDLFQKVQTASVKLRPGVDPETHCYVLDVKPKNGSLQTIYLNAETYLVQKTVEHKGGLTGTITVLGYSVQDGTEVPSRLEIQYAGLPLVIEATLKSVSRMPAVTAAFFAPPGGAKDWQFISPGPRVSAALPFESVSDEIVFQATVNGHPLRLLLDSGSGTAFVTEGAALAAGLTTQGNLPALGYGGSASTGIASDATVDVGGAVRMNHLNVHVIKNPAVTKLLTERGHLDGAIGYELFARFIVGIDYANRTLTLTDPASAPPALSAGTLAVPIKLENRMPTILASVDGKTPGRFLVDTGDSGAAHIYTQYAEANHLVPSLSAPGVTTRQGVGVGGQITEILSPGHSLRVGTAQVSGLSLSTMTGPGIAQISSQAGGIGNLFLNHFTVTFDYARSRMYLRPNVTVVSPAVFALPPPRWTFASASVAAPFTLQELLQKHLAALGGAAALEAIQNTEITTQVQAGGFIGTIKTIYAAPDKEYEEDKLAILDNLQGYDGKEAWERDTNGNVRDLAGEELKDLKIQLFFDTNSYVLPGRMPGRLILRPQTESGTGNYVVDTYPKGGKKSALFFDPRTFMIVKEQHLDDDVLVTTEFSDYRTVDGTPFPFHTRTTNGTTRYDIVGQVQTLRNNIPLPPGIFEKPSGGTNFGFIQPAVTSASVPFDMDDGEIGLEVKLNGTPERVFLDSGAGGLALAQSAADALGLKSSGFLEVRGYGGSADQHPVLIQKLEVPGAVQLSNVAAIAIDLPEQLNSYFTRPLAGFIGYDLLSHFVVRVDYSRMKLTFIRADAFHPTAADGHPLPLALDSNVPTIEARLDALPLGQFLIDTGDADAAVRLYGPYVAQNGLDRKYPHGAITVGGGIGGVSRSRRTRIHSFSVAGYTFPDIPADFSLDTKGGASLVNAGSLGSRLLSRFILTFDYPHNRVFFAPAPGTKLAFVTQTTGITLMETKDKAGHAHLAVADVLPGAPALKGGLRDYDEVLAIDGKPAAQLGLTGARSLLSAPLGPPHTLLVQSAVGKPRTVTTGSFDPLR